MKVGTAVSSLSSCGERPFDELNMEPRVFTLVRLFSFFSLPLEQKMGVRQAEETPGFQRGYIPLGGESGLADNVELKEGFCYGYAWPPSSPPVNGLTGGNEWPDDGLLGSAWRETMLRYYNTSLEVADLVMAEATRALALPPELAGLCDGGEPISTMRLFHYFAISDFPALAPGRPRLGSSAHTDWHVLTLILQDTSGGLQVLDPDGRWLDVPPVSDELVLLFGDYLQVLSEGTCRSPVHRVLLPPPGKERFSFTFFQYPAYERKVPAELVARSRDAAARRKESTPQRFNTLVASGDDAGHEALSRVPIGDLLLSKWRGVAANSVDEVASKLGAAAGA